MTTTRLLTNRYELGEVLGCGGMSEVHPQFQMAEPELHRAHLP